MPSQLVHNQGYDNPYPDEGPIVVDGVIVERPSTTLPDRRVDNTQRRWNLQRDTWLGAKRNSSVHTAEAYARDIAQWESYCRDRVGLEPWEADHAVVDAYHAFMLNTLGWEQSTRARKLAAVSSLMKRIIRFDPTLLRVDYNPVDGAERPSRNVELHSESLSADELRRLMDAAQAESPTVYALVVMLYGSGVRISEACNARVEDLTTEGDMPVLKIKAKGNKLRKIGIAEDVRDIVRAQLGSRTHGPLFMYRGKLQSRTRPLTRQMAAHVLLAMARRAGLDKRVTPHVLRHTFATLNLRAGANVRAVQAQLGHTSLETTQRYLHGDLGEGVAVSRHALTLIRVTDQPAGSSTV